MKIISNGEKDLNEILLKIYLKFQQLEQILHPDSFFKKNLLE